MLNSPFPEVRNALLLQPVWKVLYFSLFVYFFLFGESLRLMTLDGFLTDADSDSWTTAFVNKWLQSEFKPTSAAKMLLPSGDPEA